MAFRQALATGRVAESLIATWMRTRGNYVLPVYEIENADYKGPRLYAPITTHPANASREIIAPDMLAFSAKGNVVWIEAKNKSAFTHHRITDRWVTGIDLCHYEHYCQIADEIPWPVWLLFLQRGGQAKDSPPDSPAGLYGNDLAELRKTENHRHVNGGKGGMVYWAIDKLRLLAGMEEIVAITQ